MLYVNSTVGVGGPNSSLNNGRMLVALKPKHERGPLSEVIPRLRRAASAVTGMTVFFQMIQNINVGGRINKSQYQYTLQSSDTDDALQDSRRNCATRLPRSTACST